MILSSSSSDALTFGIPASMVCLWLATRAGRKRRLLDDTPISKALGVFIGEVELEGACVVREPFTSYLAERPCVCYSWAVSEHWERQRTETYTDEKGNTRTRVVTDTGWETVDSGGEAGGFYLQDETGYVWINPDKADLETVEMFNETVDEDHRLYYHKGPSESVHGSTGERTFTETGLPVGTKLFIRGRASERKDVVAAQIAYDPKAEFFVITPRPFSELSSGKATAYILWNMVGLACLVGAASSGVSSSGSPGLLVAFSFFYALAWAGGWVWMVFNSLVGLRKRVEQARSLIDIQLKRRADLIPPLVACVQSFRAHEAEVQTMVARLRAQAGGGGVAALAPTLTALVERYPDLRAQGSFSDLQRQLVETEDRIALARAYHSNIATFYNTRLERVPDCEVAGLLHLQPEPLFAAEGFERTVVQLKF